MKKNFFHKRITINVLLRENKKSRDELTVEKSLLKGPTE